MTRLKIKNLVQIFCAFLLFTGSALGAAFQFGGLRLDKLVVTSSSSTVVLTKAHQQVNIAQGSANQVYKLPDAQTLQSGYWYDFINESSGTLTISNSSSTVVYTLSAASPTAPKSARLYLTSTATTGGPWSISPGAGSSSGGGGAGAVLTKTTDYPILSGDFTNGKLLLECNCTVNCVQTLPAASNSGLEAAIINIGTANCAISTTGSDKFGSSNETTWNIPPGGSPQGSNKFFSNGGSRWNGF